MNEATPTPEVCRNIARQILAKKGMDAVILAGEDVGLSIGEGETRSIILFLVERFHMELGQKYQREFFYQETWDARLALNDIAQIAHKFALGQYELSTRRRGLRRRISNTCLVRVPDSDESPFVFDQIV